MGRHIRGVRIIDGVLEIPEVPAEAPLLSTSVPPMDDAEWVRFVEFLVPQFTERSGLKSRQCTTCGCLMHRRPTPLGSGRAARRQLYRERYTRGHLIPAAQRTGRARAWLPQCGKCNNDQSDQTLYDWALTLQEEDDPRAEQVRSVLLTLVEIGVHPVDVCGTRARPWGDRGAIDRWLGQADPSGDPAAG